MYPYILIAVAALLFTFFVYILTDGLFFSSGFHICKFMGDPTAFVQLGMFISLRIVFVWCLPVCDGVYQ